MSLLTDDADVATWNNQGLPSDRMSTENATILCNTERWPLIVDAQLQGIKWIKNKYGSELKAIRLGQKRCSVAGTPRAGSGGGGPSGQLLAVRGNTPSALCPCSVVGGSLNINSGHGWVFFLTSGPGDSAKKSKE